MSIPKYNISMYKDGTQGQIAEVVLPRTLKNGEWAIFHYHIPPHLSNLLQVGQLVWVPLKTQQIQGVILRIVNHTPQARTNLRDILDMTDPEAIIPPIGLQLAHSVAQTYVCTLYEALALFLPPGIAQTADIIWRATPEGRTVQLSTLSEHERGVLYYLRKNGATTEHTLQQELRGGLEKLREICAFLQGRGLLERSINHSRPRIRPRQEHLACLVIPPEHMETTRESLKRYTKQYAVIQWFNAKSNETEHHNDAGWYPVNHIYAATGATISTLRALERKGILALQTREVFRNPLIDEHILPDQHPLLTPGQRHVWEHISQALDGDVQHGDSPVFLLHGVTGSGKTEIYLRAVARTLRKEQQALILVPEIALTTQLVRRFVARFGHCIAVLHSKLSLGERYDEWRRVRRGEATIVIGSRSAVFAPLSNPGLIIIDEEHEPSYKSDEHPRYHARDVALALARLSQSVVILGSATPSVESYYAAQTGRFRLLNMPERIGSIRTIYGPSPTNPLPMPHVQLVDMRQELQSDNRSIFSRALQQTIGTALEQKEQIILYLNRRGAATFVMCRDCGHTMMCPACQVPLILHYEEDDDSQPQSATSPEMPRATLVCHSCRHRVIVPAFCPECLSTRMKSFGIGTQRVEHEMHLLFPQARTIRWDGDSVPAKDTHSRILDYFLNHERDVLIGTQMIAKGLDLPRVSVVGVIAADTGLFIPDFRSGERTFQLLTQVAGRAGRRSAGAEVVIQTYNPQHYALRAAQEHNYHAFYLEEISFRRQTAYPPFAKLVRFIYTNQSQTACEKAANELATRLQLAIKQFSHPHWGIIGPAPAFIQKQRGRWRWHIILRYPQDPASRDELYGLLKDVGPLHGWVVDVDPMHVL